MIFRSPVAVFSADSKRSHAVEYLVKVGRAAATMFVFYWEDGAALSVAELQTSFAATATMDQRCPHRSCAEPWYPAWLY